MKYRTTCQPFAERDYPVDVYETDESFDLLCDLPGFQKDQISVEITEGRTLHLSAKREDHPEGKRLLSERPSPVFERSLAFPVNINQDQIQASLSDGVLRLRLPKELPKRTSIVIE
ncbi:HSP20-like chaperone [Gorgonomyces haynaldii]|nr:HSP20-like chaperone [Gorgonomyces haynaldii]KAI8907389.1 HSP20-like chaperone [Gorgonomyces haynaldii]